MSKEVNVYDIFLDKVIRHLNAIVIELKKLKEKEKCENQTRKNMTN